jgi:hypothetical protein
VIGTVLLRKRPLRDNHLRLIAGRAQHEVHRGNARNTGKLNLLPWRIEVGFTVCTLHAEADDRLCSAFVNHGINNDCRTAQAREPVYDLVLARRVIKKSKHHGRVKDLAGALQPFYFRVPVVAHEMVSGFGIP